MTTVHTRQLQQYTRSANNNYTKDNLKLATIHTRSLGCRCALNLVETSWNVMAHYRGQLKCDGTRAETRFRLSAKMDESIYIGRWASVQSTTGSRGVRINVSNAGYTMFRGSVKCTGYPLHSPVSPSLPLPCVTVCHHISTGLYFIFPPFTVIGTLKMGHFEICIFLFTACIFWQVKSPKLRRMSRASHVARTSERSGVYRVLMGETWGKDTTWETQA